MASFWRVVAFNLSEMFEVGIPRSPTALILNDLSKADLTFDQETSATSWAYSGEKTDSYPLAIVYSELSTA